MPVTIRTSGSHSADTANKAPEAPATARLAIMVRAAILEPTARAASKASREAVAEAANAAAAEVVRVPPAAEGGAASDRDSGLQLCHSKAGDRYCEIFVAFIK